MRLLSRTRHDFVLLAWALAPAASFLVLVHLWMQPFSLADWPQSGDFSQPVASLTTKMFLELFAWGAILTGSIVALLRDVWSRPLAPTMKKLWTVIVLFAVPYGAVVYWLLHCHKGAVQPEAQVAQ